MTDDLPFVRVQKHFLGIKPIISPIGRIKHTVLLMAGSVVRMTTIHNSILHEALVHAELHHNYYYCPTIIFTRTQILDLPLYIHI